MGFTKRGDDPVTAWQIFAVFAGGMAAGIALGWLGGHMTGFYFGRRLERKRISRLLAGKTALEVVTQLMKTGKLEPAKPKTRPAVAGKPGDETRH